MKIERLFFVFFLFLLAPLCFGEDKPGSEWFPFVVAEKLDAASAANIGNALLDAPAGKHGFLKARHGHFYFQDGTAAKFWGTNLVFNACFPSKQEAEIIAGRLAFFGFNAVRLHHMDFAFEPKGIFKDTCPASPDPQMKKTGTLSPEQLDRLDYLVYQLKLRGIYIDLNLLVSRHFTKADGIPAADKLGMAAKPASLFDPKLIELQKQYAHDLLTHYNPYTKLRYSDDPAIALVEITNENSMFMSKTADLPDYYSVELKNSRKEWLQKQDKKKTLSDFYVYLEKRYFSIMLDFLKNDCGVKVPVTGIGGYWVKEDIRAQEACDFIDTHAYWDHPRFPHIYWDEKDFRINDTSVLSDKHLGLIEEIRQRAPRPGSKPFTISEWNHCYPNRYAYETPLLIASEALKHGWDGLFQFAFKHGATPSLTFDSIDYYFDVMNNPQQLILLSLASALFLKTERIETKIDKGILFIDTARLQAVVGSIKDKILRLGPFTITSDQDGAVVLYKRPNGFLLVTVGEVKNTGSGWNKKGRFDWGKGPVLLKKINIQCQTSLKNSFRVYELNEQGGRENELKAKSVQGESSFSTSGSYSPWFEIEFEQRREGQAKGTAI